MSPEPRATYRLQLGPGFGFAAAAELVPYLAELGVSHLYLSPCFQARPGSEHGYDVVSFQRVSAELGGEPGFEQLSRLARAHGLALLVDMVPNHMALGGPENAWWWDVLEKGPHSLYASFFDLDWQAVSADGGLILPLLADHYGRVLEAGELRLERDGDRFVVRYAEHVFPVALHTLAELLDAVVARHRSQLLAFVAQALHDSGGPSSGAPEAAEARPRGGAVPHELLQRILREDAAVARAVDDEIARVNRAPDRLDKLLDKQVYRLAFWRIASRQLSYRRFFDVDQLVALRVEDPRVFAATHELLARWLEQGMVHGVRVDHIDGLRDPAEYLERLRSLQPCSWILVEKILIGSERLPANWCADGTTGYDFLNLVNGLFVDPGAQKLMTELYASCSDEPAVDYRKLLVEKKRAALADLFGSDLKRLTALCFELCRGDRCHRDYTDFEVESALGELCAQLRVYRTYVRPGEAAASESDVERIGEAVRAARRARDDLPADLLDFLEGVLLRRAAGAAADEIALRFQQLSGPVMAKGGEDTAFYAYNRFIALNEVGGDPARFGTPPGLFHEFCARAQQCAPHGLLASSTHDTKRSEDVRARLAVLSEIPEEWAAAVQRWSKQNGRARCGAAPDGDTEYQLYQTLVGAWPLEAERVVGYMQKAAREAKLHTSWRKPNDAYEQALRRFVRGVLADEEFIADLEAFVSRLLRPGRINSLAQALIKLTAPGVPDLYQGTELWDLSLVDPDNRRSVDFSQRHELLRELAAGRLDAISPEALQQRWAEGLPKLWLIRRALELRARRPELFGARSSYAPLTARGAHAERVVAFVRGAGAVTAVPRFVMGLGDWADTQLQLPAGAWTNALGGDSFRGGAVRLADLFRRFPVALLENCPNGKSRAAPRVPGISAAVQSASSAPDADPPRLLERRR